MSTFKALGVHKNYLKSLKELGIVTPTEIQQQAIPILLTSKTDLVGLAQTGTGKTAAFGLPILHHIEPQKKQVQALILAPTRELVQQIKKQLFKFTKYNEHSIFAEGVYGGEKIDIQLKREPRQLPKLQFAPKNIFTYKMNDFELNDYDPHPAIKANMNV